MAKFVSICLTVCVLCVAALTGTPTSTPTLTSSSTSTSTPTPSPTITATPTPTFTRSGSETQTATRTSSLTPTTTSTLEMEYENRAVEIAAFIIAIAAAVLGICLVCLALLALLKAAPKAVPPPVQSPPAPVAPPAPVVGPEYLEQARQLQETQKQHSIKLDAQVTAAEKSLYDLERWVSNTLNTWETKKVPIVHAQPGSDSYVQQQIVMLLSALERLRAPQPVPIPSVSPPNDKRIIKLAKDIGGHVDRMKHLELAWQGLFDASGHDVATISQGLNSRNVPRVHSYPTTRVYAEYPQFDYDEVPRAAPSTPNALYYDYQGLPPPPPAPPRSGIKPRQPYVYDLYDNF